MIVALILSLVTLDGTPITTTSYHDGLAACQRAGAEVATAADDRFATLEYDCAVVSQESLLTFADYPGE